MNSKQTEKQKRLKSKKTCIKIKIKNFMKNPKPFILRNKYLKKPEQFVFEECLYDLISLIQKM